MGEKSTSLVKLTVVSGTSLEMGVSFFDFVHIFVQKLAKTFANFVSKYYNLGSKITFVLDKNDSNWKLVKIAKLVIITLASLYVPVNYSKYASLLLSILHVVLKYIYKLLSGLHRIHGDHVQHEATEEELLLHRHGPLQVKMNAD
jgi:hypothetical protein